MNAILVILAAGIGSRFGGGIKQITPVGPGGEIIIDYSIHDALEAGFNKVVFVIRQDIEKDFKEIVGNRTEKLCKVEYVYQEKEDLPYYPACAKNRKKPWGTTHALWACRDAVKAPFLVINADDYYGKSAYKTAYDFLVSNKASDERLSLGMIGFILENTLSENGGVTRGICFADDDGYVTRVKETYNVMKIGEDAYEVCDDGQKNKLDKRAACSMNMWCLTPDIFPILERELVAFLKSLPDDDTKSEHVLPSLIGSLIEKEEARLKLFTSLDKWVGVTYAEDKPMVIEYFKRLTADGTYPEKLYK